MDETLFGAGMQVAYRLGVGAKEDLARLKATAPWLWIDLVRAALYGYVAEVMAARALTARRSTKRQRAEQAASLELARQSVLAECGRAMQHLPELQPIVPDEPRVELAKLLVAARAAASTPGTQSEELRDRLGELAQQIGYWAQIAAGSVRGELLEPAAPTLSSDCSIVLAGDARYEFGRTQAAVIAMFREEAKRIGSVPTLRETTIGKRLKSDQGDRFRLANVFRDRKSKGMHSAWGKLIMKSGPRAYTVQLRPES